MTPKPLEGVRVAITRAREQAEGSARDVLECGGIPCLFPLLQFTPIAQQGAVAEAVSALQPGDALAFSSANGVRFAVDIARDALADARDRGVLFAAVGGLTAAALRAEGLPPHITPPSRGQHGQGLARALLRALSPSARVLAMGARDGRQELTQDFDAAGRELDVLALYATHSADAAPLWAALGRKEIDALVFASPSAVEAFVSSPARAALPDHVHVVCIGPTTRDEAMALGLRVDATPPSPTMKDALEALAALRR